ncbi:MAG: NrdH-redoxin [Dehalococcoidia bacterium]|nr:NrdH-redoxin [Dehalococcoidia bacterium]
MNEKITVYGTTWCSDCRRAKQLMDSYNIEYNWTDIDEEPEFQNLVKEINDGKSIVPTIIFPDGSVLVEPSNSELIKKLNL